MIKKYLTRYNDFKSFIGSRTTLLLQLMIGLGLLWFAFEISFVFVVQAYMYSLGVVTPDKTYLPEWFFSSPSIGIVLLLLFGVGRGAVAATKSFFGGILPQAFIRHQRERIFAFAIAERPLRMSADLMNLFGDKTAMSSLVIAGLGNLVVTGVTLIPFILCGLYMAPEEFIIGVVLFGIGILPVRLISRKINSSGKGISEESGTLSRIFVSALRNRFLIWIYNVGDFERRRTNTSLDRNYDIHARYFFLSALKHAYTSILSVAVVCAVSYISIFYLHTPGMKLIGLFYIFLRLGTLASDVNSFVNEIKAYGPSFKVIYNLNNELNAALLEHDRPAEAALAIQNMSVRDLSFAYADRKQVLDKVSFSLQKGDVLLIKGESGSGKSTLISLLLGLLKPSAGEVRVNGEEVQTVKRRMSHSLSYVGPEPFIFPGSVRENLVYGNKQGSITDDKIWNVLKSAELDGIIRELNGLDSFLNEDTQLSTGQKQAFRRR
jgi:ABC-type multidrug transport system fused ATPase/permease subunit